MSYFISTGANFNTAIKNPASDRCYKVIIDSVDVTQYVIPGTISGSISANSISDKWSVSLRNTALGWAEGDKQGVTAVIQATVNSESYITVFTGRVSERGATRTEKELSEDTVTLQMESGLTEAGTRRKIPASALAGFKISDPSNTSASIIHYLAGQMGESTIDVNEIDQTKDYVTYSGSEKPWSELQSIEKQFIGELYFSNTNVLTFRSIFDTGYTDPTSEWTFSNNPDDDGNGIHQITAYNTAIKGNRVTTEFDEYETLTAGGEVFRFTDTYDSSTGYITIEVGAGEYYPGPNAGDVLRCRYAQNGEELAFATDVITPTIGTTGTEDIYCTGGTLTLISFNGSTSATDSRAESAEIILRNNTGSTITIKKLTIRGTGVRIKSKNEVVSTGDNVISNDWEYKDVTLPGKYACNTDQANTSTTWAARAWENPRKNWQIETDWLPNARPRAVVTLIKPDDATEYTCRITEVRHTGVSGKPNSYLRTSLKLEELFTTTVATTPRVIRDEVPALLPVLFTDRPTYTEVQTGYDAGGGTTTPSAPTLTVSAFFKSIALKWTNQNNLTNLDYYEVQVSDDQSNWYSLEFDGSDWKDTLDAVTVVYNTYVTHSNLPFVVSGETPSGKTLYYRVRSKTKAGVASNWSTAASDTTSVIDYGDLADEAIISRVIAASALNWPEDAIIYYPMDEMSGTSLKDTKSGNDGTLTNFGPVAEYHFDGDVTDETGNYDGVATDITYTTGVSGQAAVFNGTTSKVVLGTSTDFKIKTTGFTINFWVKAVTGQADYLLFARKEVTGVAVDWSILNFNNGLYLQIRDSSNVPKDFSTYRIPYNNTSYTHGVFKVDLVSANNWRVSVYSNGILLGLQTISLTMNTVSGETRIGLTGTHFVSSVDDLRFFDYAITEAQISALYTRPQMPSYWVDGVGGGALSFNGTDTYVSLPAITLPGSEHTFSFFCDDDITTHDGVGGTNDTLIDFYNATASNRLLLTKSYIGDARFGILTNGTFRNFSTDYYVSGLEHVAIVISGTSASLYIGGIFKETISIGTAISSIIGTSVRIGARGNLDTSSFVLNGVLAEPRYYPRALTAAEIKTLSMFKRPGTGLLLADQIRAGLITADMVNATVLNTLIANINQYLEISETAGYLSKNYTGTPTEGARRVYMDQDEIVLQEYISSVWSDVIKIGSVKSAGDNYMLVGDQVKSLTYADDANYTSITNAEVIKYIETADSGTALVRINSGYTTMSRSTDGGENWSALTVPFTDIIHKVAYGNGVFVAVGNNGEVSRSTDDGATWSSLISNSHGAAQIYSVAYGDGVFVMCGNLGRLSRSTDDGATWSSLITTSYSTDTMREVVYGDGVFIVFGSNYIIRSLDGGVTWSALIELVSSGTRSYWPAIYIDNKFIAGHSGSTYMVRSYDNGVTWEEYTSTGPSVCTVLNAYNGNIYLMSFTSGYIADTIETYTPSNIIPTYKFYLHSENKTFTLPDVDSVSNATIKIIWAGGDGNYTLTINGTINGYSSWVGRGDGSLTIFSDGTSWYTQEEGIYDIVSKNSQHWEFKINGEATVISAASQTTGTGTIQNYNIGTYGWSTYLMTASITFEYTVVSVIGGPVATSTGIATRYFSVSTSGFSVAVETNSATAVSFNYSVNVRWR